MRFVGIDLHKRSLTVHSIDRDSDDTVVRKLYCHDVAGIVEFFESQRPFQAVVEASATYEWLWELLEPMAERLVLAHPAKVRVIAESTKKTDKFDAKFLAWLLSVDGVPEAHRPSPRQREYQLLSRHRVYLVRQSAKIRVKLRHIFANRNITSEGKMTPKVALKLAEDLRPVEALCVRELVTSLESLTESVKRAEAALKDLRAAGTESEKKNRAIVESIPGVGHVVCDVVFGTLGDVSRFKSRKKVCGYSGLAPGSRISDKKRKDLPITKKGPSLLRWMMVQAAWRASRSSEFWAHRFDSIAEHAGKKKATVAVARRLVALVYTLLRKGEMYREPPVPRCPPPDPTKPGKMRTTSLPTNGARPPMDSGAQGQVPCSSASPSSANSGASRSGRGRRRAPSDQLPRRSAKAPAVRRPLGRPKS